MRADARLRYDTRTRNGGKFLNTDKSSARVAPGGFGWVGGGGGGGGGWQALGSASRSESLELDLTVVAKLRGEQGGRSVRWSTWAESVRSELQEGVGTGWWGFGLRPPRSSSAAATTAATTAAAATWGGAHLDHRVLSHLVHHLLHGVLDGDIVPLARARPVVLARESDDGHVIIRDLHALHHRLDLNALRELAVADHPDRNLRAPGSKGQSRVHVCALGAGALRCGGGHARRQPPPQTPAGWSRTRS